MTICKVLFQKEDSWSYFPSWKFVKLFSRWGFVKLFSFMRIRVNLYSRRGFVKLFSIEKLFFVMRIGEVVFPTRICEVVFPDEDLWKLGTLLNVWSLKKRCNSSIYLLSCFWGVQLWNLRGNLEGKSRLSIIRKKPKKLAAYHEVIMFVTNLWHAFAWIGQIPITKNRISNSYVHRPPSYIVWEER